MKRTLLVAAAGVAAGALAAAVGAGAHGTRAERVFTVVERATSIARTDTGAVGDTAGDIRTLRNDLYDARNARRVGRDHGYCLRIEPEVSFECAWTTFLPEGQITVQGPRYDGRPSTLAITGGTGAYRDARGVLEVRPRGKGRNEYSFTFRTL